MPNIHFDPFEAQQADESIINRIPFIIAFDVLQILGLVFISAILCIALLSPRIRRSTAWFSHNCTWALSCVGYLLIFGHQMGSFPGPTLCLGQAMLIYAFPALNALNFTVLTLEIFVSISPISRTTMMFLYFIPYGIFVAILIAVLILGLLNPTAVLREPFGMFCHMSIPTPLRLTSAIVVCCMIASLTLGVRIALKCCKHWSTSKILLTRNKTPFGLVLRVGLLGACMILAIVVAVIDIFILNWNKRLIVSSNLPLAVLAMLVGIIFGSQGDILRALMFWRKPPQTLPTLATSTELETITYTRTQP